MTAKPECGRCKFWVQMDSYNKGFCHRSTPHVYIGTGFSASLGLPNGMWPETWPDSWCGEFVEREEEK